MAIIKLKPLFKKTSTGSIQQWIVAVEETTIITTFGLVGGKLQTTRDTVKSGKNAGRKNETVPEEQALKEAKSQWIKKKKSGYVETIKEAEDGETDSIIEGGVVPMLAKVYEEHTSKIKYPVAVQPKLDGHRCICVIDRLGHVTLWTRTRKRITSVPHIEKQVEMMAKKMNLFGKILDGELYSDSLKDNFEKITSATRTKEATQDSILIQYHVYDMVSDKCFRERILDLTDIVVYGGGVVELVPTKISKSEEESKTYYKLFMKMGYEGSMVRLLGMPYENKRSHQLLKVKEFQDEEFQVIGVEEGRGKLQGHAGAFVVMDMFSGKKFKVKMSGNTSNLKEYWKNSNKYIGKMLTVQFQGRTSDGIPRFPVGLRFFEAL